MADDAKPDATVTLMATERGFYAGSMVHPGQTFAFAAVGSKGQALKLPKWAALPHEAKVKGPKPMGGDLKPKAAQAAVKAKAGALAGTTDG